MSPISVSPLRFLRKSTPNPLWESKKYRNIRFWAAPFPPKSVQNHFQTYTGVEYDGRTQQSWVGLGLKLDIGCATAPPSRRFGQNQRFRLFWDTFSEVWSYCGISSEWIAEANTVRGPHIPIFTQKYRFGGMPTTLRGEISLFLFDLNVDLGGPPLLQHRVSFGIVSSSSSPKSQRPNFLFVFMLFIWCK